MSKVNGGVWWDLSWNPVDGCTKVSPECDHCYAEAIANRFWTRPFSQVECHEERLYEPLKRKRPHAVFVVNMGDLFHPLVPVTFQDAVFDAMDRAPWHTYFVLTKRPMALGGVVERRQALGKRGLPVSVWCGVTTGNQALLVDRMGQLLEAVSGCACIPPRLFISAEPMLGALDAGKYLGVRWNGQEWVRDPDRPALLSWVICGAETGPAARPTPAPWVRALRDQCAAAHIPFWFKTWGARLGHALDGRAWRQHPLWPAEICQETGDSHGE